VRFAGNLAAILESHRGSPGVRIILLFLTHDQAQNDFPPNESRVVAMKLEAAVTFLSAGLKREKLALANRDKLLAKFAKRLKADQSLVDIVEFAHQALESEENAYQWLVQDHLLLNRRSPVQAMLDGDGAHVRQLLANIEHSMPV
jgi:hypothetical protein